MAKKMTMAEYEASPMDAAADRKGLHGPEGSPKDMAADRAALNKINGERNTRKYARGGMVMNSKSSRKPGC